MGGLHGDRFNYEVVQEGRARLAMTLLRATGKLSTKKDESTTRANAAEPSNPVPRCQCLGRRFEMRFVLRPFGRKEADVLMEEAALLRARPSAAQVWSWYPWRPSENRPKPLIQISSPAVVIGAFKWAQDQRSLILRLWNPRRRRMCCRLEIPMAKSLQSSNLAEKGFGAIRTGGGCEKRSRGDSLRWAFHLAGGAGENEIQGTLPIRSYLEGVIEANLRKSGEMSLHSVRLWFGIK